MMTRDPLEVPCLTEKYWATFEDLPGIHLARTLTTVREHASKHPLPRVGSLALDERLKVEEDNVRASASPRRGPCWRRRWPGDSVGRGLVPGRETTGNTDAWYLRARL